MAAVAAALRGSEPSVPRAGAAAAPPEGVRRLHHQRRDGRSPRRRAPIRGRRRPRSWTRCPPRRSSRRRRSRVPASSTCGRPTTGSTTSLRQIVREGERYGAGAPTGRADPGGVRLREPDRPAHDRSRAERRDRRRARPAPDVRRARGRAGVLLQRRRRPDGSLRRVRRGSVPPAPRPRGRDARGRLPRRLRDRPRPRRSSTRRVPASPTSRRKNGSSGSGRRARAARWSRSARRSSGSGSPSTRTSSRRRSWSKGEIAQAIERLREAGVRLRRRGRDVVPLDRVRRRQGPRRDPLGRDAHVLRRRHRLRPRQVLARLRPPDLRLGRRSPRRRRDA